MTIAVLETLIFALILGLAQGSCPSGTSNHGNKCYAYLGMDFDHPTALKVCQETYGPYARLAQPTSSSENSVVTQLVQKHTTLYTWLEYVANGEYFVGPDGHPPAYTKFAIGEPFSVEVGYCASIGVNGFWYAQPCTDAHSALCEMDSKPKTTPTPKPTTTTTIPYYGYPSCVQKYLNFVPCASGWEYYPETCSCFKIISNTTYYNAMNICRSQGATLASVHNSGEAAFIQRLASETNSYWISTATARDNIIVGLTYNTEKGNFQWDDLTTFDFPQGFAPGEPSTYSAQGQIILSSPMGYRTYMRMFDCSYQQCRYAACKKYVY